VGEPPPGLGAFIREQRRLANLSIRRLADLAQISNPYLSQLERGLHEPSVRVLNSLAQALDLSAEVLLDQAGLLRDVRTKDKSAPGDPSASSANAPEAGGSPGTAGSRDTERAIRSDSRLSDSQKRALLTVYRSYIAAPAAHSAIDLVSNSKADSSTVGDP
jgi:transcriptional regulator with XRE-family HTH domain